MTTRYFKATDGTITVFRASKTRVYGSAKREPMISWTAGTGLPMPAVEISKAEYDRLVILKGERVSRTWKGPNMPRWYGNSPQDSWIENAVLRA